MKLIPVLAVFISFLSLSGAYAAPGTGTPSSSQTGPGLNIFQKPDLLLYGCSKKVMTPQGTPPDQVQIELRLVIQNIGSAKSKSSKVDIEFTQAGRTLSYDIPALPHGPYGSTPLEVNGNIHWSGKNTFYLKKTITPYADILPIDLSNGLTANVVLDPENTVKEKKENNNKTPCDFSLAA